MQILNTAIYIGPSIYARFPVIRLDVDLGALEDWPSGRLGRRFTDGLLAALPGLADHGCSFRAPGGFVRRLTEGEGTWFGHIFEHVALELQNVAGEEVSFGKTRSNGPRGHYYVVYQYPYEAADIGLAAGALALTLLRSLLPDSLRPPDAVPEGFDFAVERDRFIRRAQERALGPSGSALVRAAERRGIPWMRLDESSLVLLGQGRYQRRIRATVTNQTSHIAVELACDKEATNRMLANLGLPVPMQGRVESADAAVLAAGAMGYPVVIKPPDGNHGRGISIRLTSPGEVRDAFELAQQHGDAVLIERFIPGCDHRILVVNGRMVAASRRTPGHVVGDGIHTIRELVDAVNRDPRRGVGHEKVLTRIELDAQADRMLARRHYTRDSVPHAGERVPLRATANLSTGGTAADVTDVVHPENAEMAVRAVAAIGLDVGGVDFITEDISRSYGEVGGAICEVNAAPGLRMHLAPSEGQPRDVAEPILDMLFPPGARHRIPIAAITGTNGKTTTARMLAHIHKLAGRVVGLTTTDGVYLGGQRTVAGDMTGPAATRMVLSEPTVEVAVLEIARGGLLRAGMGIDSCDVAAALNVQSDHLGLRGIETLDDMAKVKRIVVEAARDTAVLNADDPRCLEMAAHCDARHLCYVTTDPSHELVREHIQAGGRAVVLERAINEPMITIYDRGAHIPLVWIRRIPATVDGRATHHVQNAMFAAALAYSMGVRLEDIRQGLQSFGVSFFQAPGRGNIYDEHPFRVILDYGHNAAAVQAMVEFTERLEVTGRRIVVLTCPGDRRDEDIAAVARAAAGRFDRYICRRDDALRGRDPDEVPQLLRDALLAGGVPAGRIRLVPEEERAVLAALHEARAGDLVLIFADEVTRGWRQIVEFRPNPTVRRRMQGNGASGGEQAPPVPLVRDQRGVRLRRRAELELETEPDD